MTKLLMAGALAAALAGCVTAPGFGDRASSKSYAYVVLGEEGGAVARLITTAPACPPILLDEKESPMDVRARPETIPLRPTISGPAASKPSAFPVLVCEKN